MKLELFGVKLPEIKVGDDIGKLICESFELRDGDIVVITSKIVSKAEGRIVKIDEVKPSKEAEEIAKKVGKSAKLVELILRNSRVIGTIPVFELVKRRIFDPRMLSEDVDAALRVLERDKSLLLTIVNSSIYSDAGIDLSNVPPGYAALPPADPIKSARKIRESIRSFSGKDVAVLISDTEIFIGGSIEVCRGYAGICPVKRKFGEKDIYGKPKWGGCEALVHEICCAASLLMGQSSESVPVVVIRGLSYERKCEIKESNLYEALKIVARENAKLFGIRKIIGAVLQFLK